MNASPTPETRSEFLIDDDGNPIIFYHGTRSQFQTFDASKNANGIVFFSTIRGFAEEWAEDRSGGESPVRIIEAQIRSVKAWDYSNTENVRDLIDAIRSRNLMPDDPDMFTEGIEDGDWMYIEQTPGVINIIREMGFEAMFITEGSDMDRNIAIFDTANIEILDPPLKPRMQRFGP